VVEGVGTGREGGPPYSYSREVQGVGTGREEGAPPPHNNTRVVVAAIPSEHRQGGGQENIKIDLFHFQYQIQYMNFC
jgi:hypothetical protein